jgi:hypothetical protein
MRGGLPPSAIKKISGAIEILLNRLKVLDTQSMEGL